VRLLTALIAGEPSVQRHQLMRCELEPGATAGPVRR
jgi:hypothetical protein